MTLDQFCLPDASVQKTIDQVIRSRRTVRAYSKAPVAKSTVFEILDVARTAPSNSNTQPWRVHVLGGAAKQQLTSALLASHEADLLPQSNHFPAQLPAICRPRQADFGFRYYKALGIERDDAAARYRQTSRNYHFFDAPVGMIFTIDRALTRHSWLDLGLFLQTLMIAARARGLDTCPQVSFVRHEPVIRDVLSLSPEETVACGMSLGYADRDAALNSLAMPRAHVEEFAVFSGFDE